MGELTEFTYTIDGELLAMVKGTEAKFIATELEAGIADVLANGFVLPADGQMLVVNFSVMQADQFDDPASDEPK